MPAPDSKFTSWAAEVLALPNDSRRKTVFVALALCLICSIVVSGAAVVLKPLQAANQALDRKRNIVEVAGLLVEGVSVDQAFEQIETRIVDLATGEYTDVVDSDSYNVRKAVKDPHLSEPVAAAEDIAGIKRKPKYTPVYLVREGEAIKTIILPVHGYGLWSTLYGFLALDSDTRTVRGLKFYEHAETPGLGGEVDNPRWLSQWPGKLAYDEQGQLRLEVVKGRADPDKPEAQHQVDGLAGATLTSRGVTNLLQYWLSKAGYGPYLARLRGENHG